MHPDVVREKQRLDNIFSMVEGMPFDSEVLSHWSRYLCVLTSGYIENALRLILQHYCASNANNSVTNFVRTRIDKLTNLNEQKIAQLLGAFDPAWRDTFQAKCSAEQKAAFDSILANRHQIAHGRSVGLTLVRMRQYYAEISRAVKVIDERCVNGSHGRNR